MPRGPEVAIVSKPKSFAALGERTAWTASGPDAAAVRPSGHAKRERPNPNACEEMALDVAADVAGADVADVAVVDISCWNKSICAEIAKPLRAIRVIFIVVNVAAHAPWAGGQPGFICGNGILQKRHKA